MVRFWNTESSQELHHERLSAISDRKREGLGENLQWGEQENHVTVMQKKTDSEELKMMQLLSHVAIIFKLNKFTWKVKFGLFIFKIRIKIKLNYPFPHPLFLVLTEKY